MYINRIEPENKIITLTRGDTLVFPIKINVNTKLCPKYRSLQPGETIYFAVMEPGQAFENAVLKKVLTSDGDIDTDGNSLVRINPEDTEKLLVGKYYYTAKLRSVDGFGYEIVKTLIPSTLFFLTGNNPVPEDTKYYEEGSYDVDTIILEGGEIE